MAVLDAEVQSLIYGSKAASTWKKYTAAFSRFSAWCLENLQPSLPSSPEVVMRYLAHVSKTTKSANSMVAATCAISAFHMSRGLANPCADKRVAAMCEGARRRYITPARQSKPLTPVILKAMQLQCKNRDGNVRDLRTVWLAHFLFRACARFQDAARLKLKDFSETDDGLLVKFWVRKNDQKGAGHTVKIPKSASSFCAVRLGESYFSKLRREGFQPGDWAFPRMDSLKNGKVKIYKSQPATYNSCKVAFSQALSSLGVDPTGYGLHSGKVGGVIALRNSGVSWRSLSDFVGWSANSVMPERYAKSACKRSSKVEGKLSF